MISDNIFYFSIRKHRFAPNTALIIDCALATIHKKDKALSALFHPPAEILAPGHVLTSNSAEKTWLEKHSATYYHEVEIKVFALVCKMPEALLVRGRKHKGKVVLVRSPE